MNNTSTTAAGCLMLGLVFVALVMVAIVGIGLALNIVERL